MPLLMVPLQRKLPAEQRTTMQRSYQVHNYLFTGYSGAKQYWLYNHNDYLIEQYQLLRNGDVTEPVVAILYQVVTTDSNGDQLLSSTDLTTIALSHIDGSDYKELITGVEQLIDYHLLNNNTLVLSYKKSATYYNAWLRLSTQKMVISEISPPLSIDAVD